MKLDVDFEKEIGMSVGRLREITCQIMSLFSSHNTVRGAAGGAVLCANTDCKRISRQNRKEKREGESQ